MNTGKEVEIEQVIKEYVKRFEQEYSGSSIYNECLKDVRGIELGDITEEEVEEVIKPFLYEWGRMGRVLGRPKFFHWESELRKQIQFNCERLEGFRKQDLSDVDLSEFESDIEKCYESFEKAIGRIAATKVLHLICPNLFPLWDNDIARAVKNELDRKSEGRNEVDNSSGADYYRFMQEMQNLIKEYKGLLSDLANRYKKGELKILDECLWWATHRPLSLFL